MSRITGVPDEGRDNKAGNLWSNLAAKLGYAKEMTKAASVQPVVERLSDGVQTHGANSRPVISVEAGARPGRTVPVAVGDMALIPVSRGAKTAALTRDVMAAAVQTSVEKQEPGQTIGMTPSFTKARAAIDRATRLIRHRALALGAEAGRHEVKASELSQLLDRIQQIETADAPSYQAVLDQIIGGIESYTNGLQSPGMGDAGMMGPMDSIAPSMAPMVAKLASAAYNNLSFARTLAEYLAAQGAVRHIAAARTPQTKGGLIRQAAAAMRGTLAKFGATGDPGDMDAGNTIYKDLRKCRDCVWFESDWTHETYMDKCKNCTHAKLGGTVEHYWPRAAQMMIWMPTWTLPQAEKEAMLSAPRAGSAAAQAWHIASDIVNSTPEPTAEKLSAAFWASFNGPAAGFVSRLGGRVAQRIAEITGIDFAITVSKAKEWGWRAAGDLQEGGVILAYPKTLQDEMRERVEKQKGEKEGPKLEQPPMKEAAGKMHPEKPKAVEGDSVATEHGKPVSEKQSSFEGTLSLSHFAKGERQKIRNLREQLDGEKEPVKIKQINDAIDAMESRMDKDKERKEKRKEDKAEKAKEKAAEPAKEAVTASIYVTAKPYKGYNIKKRKPDYKGDDSFPWVVTLRGKEMNAFEFPEDAEAWVDKHPENPHDKAASFRGTFRLAQDNEDLEEIERHTKGIEHEVKELEEKGKESSAGLFSGTLSLAGAKERENKQPKNYGNANPPKPLKALATLQVNDQYVNSQGVKIKVMADGKGQIMESPVPDFTQGESVVLEPDFETQFQKMVPKAASNFAGTLTAGRSL